MQWPMGKQLLPFLVIAGLSPVVALGESAHHHGHEHMAMSAPAPAIGVPVSYTIPDVTLIGMDGKAVSLVSELDTDVPVLLNFIFTTCTVVCPVTSETFSRVQKELTGHGEKFRMISISIDPEEDTPPRLREFALKYGAGPDWRFLTGSFGDSLTVQQAFDAYRGNKMNHAPVTYLRATRGGPWMRYEGFLSASTLIGEFRKMTAQKGGE